MINPFTTSRDLRPLLIQRLNPILPINMRVFYGLVVCVVAWLFFFPWMYYSLFAEATRGVPVHPGGIGFILAVLASCGFLLTNLLGLVLCVLGYKKSLKAGSLKHLGKRISFAFYLSIPLASVVFGIWARLTM